MPGVGAANRFLVGLPPETYARFASQLQRVDLARDEVLFRAGEPLRAAYFPVTAVVSLIASLPSGAVLEAGLVGSDGVAGTAVLPGVATMRCDGVVQVGGVAERIDASVLRRAVAADAALHAAVGHYADVLLARSMQTLLCNRYHPVEQRCIRWMLTLSDLIQDERVPVTHDMLAMMLGVRRPTVTLAIHALRRAGLVTDARGRMTVRDRARLEAACCECYAAAKNLR